MASLEQKMAAEREALALLEQNGLPEPDDVEYGYTCIRLIWWEPKAALIVQIDPPPPGWVFAEDLRDLDDLRVLDGDGDGEPELVDVPAELLPDLPADGNGRAY